MAEIRKETDSLRQVDVPADKLWGAQTQRSLEHFSIGKDLTRHFSGTVGFSGLFRLAQSPHFRPNKSTF